MEPHELQMKVIRHILLSTPVGEHKNVLNDLQNLLGSEIIQSEPVLQVLLEAIALHGGIFNQDNRNWVISHFAQVSPVFYFDPKFEMQFEVNPFEHSLSNFSAYPYGDSFSRTLQAKLDEYILNHFTETSAGRVYITSKTYTLFIFSSTTNAKNLWSGEFLAEWTVNSESLSGTCTLKAHSFEEGNFQYTKTDSFRSELRETEPSLKAEEIFHLIRKHDSTFQESILELSTQVPHKLFKPMRRTMAVTRTKFSEMNKNRMLS